MQPRIFYRLVLGVALLLLLSIATYLRFVAVTDTVVDTPLRGDAQQYYFYAFNLTNHGVYAKQQSTLTTPWGDIQADKLRSPGYALFMAPFIEYPPTQNMLQNILFAQAFLGVITVILGYAFFRGFLGRVYALFATLFIALSPHLVSINTYMLTESLFATLLVASAWLTSLLIKKPDVTKALAMGFVLGLTMLVKPTINYLLLFLLPLLLVYRHKLNVRLIVAVVIGCAISYGPWVVRNQSPEVGSGGGNLLVSTLHHGMYPGMKYNKQAESYGFPYRSDPNSDDISRSLSAVVKEIARRFSTAPAQHVSWYLIGKPVSFFSWNIVQGMGDVFIYPVTHSPYFSNKWFVISHEFMRYLHWLLVGLACFSMIAVWFSGISSLLSDEETLLARLISLLILYFLVVHMVGFPLPRYAIPLYPFIYGFALLTVQIFVRQFKSNKGEETGGCAE